jgi:hypothetical protein
MGGRYLVTGVQLGTMLGLVKPQENKDIAEILLQIEENQYIGESNQGVEDDAQFLHQISMIRSI